MNIRSGHPPWVKSGSVPVGLYLDGMSSDSTCTPYSSPPRSAAEAPYQRLVLVSSLIAQPERAVLAALPDTAVIIYDWQRTAATGLVEQVHAVLCGGKVHSLAVVAPGPSAGSMALLRSLPPMIVCRFVARLLEAHRDAMRSIR
ncbi:hypothetical protein WJX72_001849 [[Myrmecia] bisecta]|uniref:Uncharacterized protein n=1 Tax=[Myrmecia] bisecta TaxID=41462 RepID=A0AAW1QPX6_9CHLO